MEIQASPKVSIFFYRWLATRFLVPTTEGLRFCFVVDYSCGIILVHI